MNYLYEVEVRHHRQSPVVHALRQRTYLWLVDLDDLPRIPLLARFEGADHVGDPRSSIRANMDAYLAAHEIDLQGGRITMLANARSFGYVFNPLSLFWCHYPDGGLACVVAEVHNTYRERHRYLLRPDDAGRADTAKEFYVSPFYPVDGYYRMSVPEPGPSLAVTITLHRTEGQPFAATVRGVRISASGFSVVRLALSHSFNSQRIRAQIVRHGIALYLKGLPVIPRPHHQDPTSSGDVARPRGGNVAERLAGFFRSLSGSELPLRLRAWDGTEAGPVDGPVLVINNRRALRRLLWSPGELGLARSYVTGDIDVAGDLSEGLRLAWTVASDRPRSAPLTLGWRDRGRAIVAAARFGAIGPAPQAPASEARMGGRLHSRERDREAIAHHYDLSNEFYERLLGPTMAYSSAYFDQADQPLADAQRAKLDLICRKLELKLGSRLLDVGCGWGSLLLHAAEHYGAVVVGVTLSVQQRDYVAKQIANRGLGALAQVRLLDYREIDPDASFDAVSSIEMGEHVGEGEYPIYAATLFEHLDPGGRLLLQQMSRRAGTHAGGGAFIASYIAPDMHMRPLSATIAFLEAAGFEIRDVEGMREHYVHTVSAWMNTFESQYANFVSLVGEEVARVWRLYLVGGRLSFEEGRMGVDQMLAVKPAARGRSDMPTRRPWVLPQS